MKKIIAYGWLGALVSAVLVFFGYALYEAPDLRFILLIVCAVTAFGLFTSGAVSETLK